jgi:hypothetical protein
MQVVSIFLIPPQDSDPHLLNSQLTCMLNLLRLIGSQTIACAKVIAAQ